MSKNIYNYTKTEINKMKREELLKLKYEQDKFYFESVCASNKKWGKEHPFEKYCKTHKQYTVNDLRKKVLTK